MRPVECVLRLLAITPPSSSCQFCLKHIEGRRHPKVAFAFFFSSLRAGDTYMHQTKLQCLPIPVSLQCKDTHGPRSHECCESYSKHNFLCCPA